MYEIQIEMVTSFWTDGRMVDGPTAPFIEWWQYRSAPIKDENVKLVEV